MQLKNIFQLLGLCCIPLVIIFAIWYVWFGPGNEPGPEFPSTPIGQFIEYPRITNQHITWVIPTDCNINELEWQTEELVGNIDGWGGATAGCVTAETGTSCSASLEYKELQPGQRVVVQAHHNYCNNGSRYVSPAVTIIYQ